jgi:hypothetical protein
MSSTINLTTYANAAAQFLGILDSGEALSTQQIADALPAANQLLESWYTEQVLAINIQLASFTLSAGTYTPDTMPQFADTTTALTLPAAWDRALKLCLAVELAPQYDMQPSESLAAEAVRAYQSATPPAAGQVKVSNA